MLLSTASTSRDNGVLSDELGGPQPYLGVATRTIQRLAEDVSPLKVHSDPHSMCHAGKHSQGPPEPDLLLSVTSFTTGIPT